MQKQQRPLLVHALSPSQLTGFFLSVLSSPRMGAELAEPRVMGWPWGCCQTVMWPWPRHRSIKGKKRGRPESVGRAQPWGLTLVLWVCFASCSWNPKKGPSYATGHLHCHPFTSAWPKANAPGPQISAGWISAGLSPTLLSQENTFFLGAGGSFLFEPPWPFPASSLSLSFWRKTHFRTSLNVPKKTQLINS